MMQLNKITLNHLRKFGTDVEIPIEKGATIFLAPNGTGKTAIFEAIELALTGGVHRLVHKSLNTLIRDTHNQASVRLDFDTDIFCQTVLNKDQAPNISGNYSNLFGDIQKENIPFLLRLTHLLDQQSNGWFVHSGGTEAGSLLDNLSIGREAIKANSVMSGAKRASTGLKENAERKKNDLEDKLRLWRDLVLRRNDVKDVQNAPINSLENILEELNRIALEHGTPGQSSSDLPALFDFLALISQLNDIKYNKEIEKKLMLQSLEVVVGNYLRFLTELIGLAPEIEQKKFLITSLETRLDEHKKNLVEELTNLTNLQEMAAKLEANKKQVDQLSNAKEEILKIEQLIISLNIDLDNQGKLVNQAKINFNEAKRLFDLKESLNNRRLKLKNNANNQVHKGNLIEQWKKNLLDLIELNSKKGELLVSKSRFEIDLKVADEKCLNANADVILIQSKFDNLNSASDSIKQAVGIITSNFPADGTDCPVCLQHYDPLELQRRMSKAVNAINPELENFKANLNVAKNEYESSLLYFNSLNDGLAVINSQLTINSADIENINAIIKTQLQPEFAGVTTIQEAEIIFNQEQEKLDEIYINIENESSNVTSVFSDDQLMSLQNFLLTEEYIERQLQNQITESNITLNVAKEVERVLSPICDESSNEIQIKIINAGLDLEALKIVIENLRNQKIESENKISDAKIQYRLVDERKKTLDRDLKVCEDLWKNADLQSIPDKQVLIDAQFKLQQNLDKIAIEKIALENIQIDLARWKAHEDYFKIQSEIDQIIGGISEEDYEVSLINLVSNANTQLEHLLEKISTLNTFSSKLSSEIESIHEKIKSINPYWNTLLKRIVIDPRFSNTNLNSYSYYKKQYADVNVPLHGQQVLASDIASEAQITDLQLTFLLAMAYKYQWSPWKGLLLDDPTQHHDLVHAAGVFDLLRDYIVDYGFQILLATHDTVQANFFMRKLQNDGIPVRLWNLESSSSGVVARSY